VLRADVEDHVARRQPAGAHTDGQLALAGCRRHGASLPYAGRPNPYAVVPARGPVPQLYGDRVSIHGVPETLPQDVAPAVIGSLRLIGALSRR